jgi:hypothetical protein|tara:strand:- start:165 stop:293 length:129 start_codon:yes stop_codon:yes gene_type:complete
MMPQDIPVTHKVKAGGTSLAIQQDRKLRQGAGPDNGGIVAAG